MNKILPAIGLGILLSLPSYSQRTCGTNENYQNMINNNPALRQQLENVDAETNLRHDVTTHRTMTIVTIPVVVHVIHDNEAVGTGSNISDVQVLSQIEALSEDFRLNNADSLMPGHPFWQFTSDVLIEFCLAKQTPNGQATTGIDRQVGGLGWTMADINAWVKPQTIWDPSRYLNLWSIDFGGSSSSLLGYAQFPGGPDSTDGVVIGYHYFGYLGNVTPPFDYGRTATHEVGHWLGLRHIWGDATCGDDFISDTPPQEASNSGCPSFPYNAFNTCGSDANGEMFMNYMDYVDDRCMVMFTYEQAVKMNTSLYGPRASLISSNACATPNPGVEENEIFAQNISLYPNPSNGLLKVQIKDISTGTLQIKVTDISGRLVKTFTFNNFTSSLSLDISELNNGLYLMQFSQHQLTTTKKISLIK